jgi:hypothetical protein
VAFHMPQGIEGNHKDPQNLRANLNFVRPLYKSDSLSLSTLLSSSVLCN